jgi:hypothetical protein
MDLNINKVWDLYGSWNKSLMNIEDLEVIVYGKSCGSQENSIPRVLGTSLCHLASHLCSLKISSSSVISNHWPYFLDFPVTRAHR